MAHPHPWVNDLASKTQTEGAHSLLGISRGKVNGTSDPGQSTLSPLTCSPGALPTVVNGHHCRCQALDLSWLLPTCLVHSRR